MIEPNKTYTGRSTIRMYNCDCMELMQSGKTWDLAIVDPPYGINAGKMTMGSGRHKFTKDKDWDNGVPNKQYFNQMFLVSENQIIWGGNYFTEYLKPTPHWIVWDKRNPNLSFAEGELAWMSSGKNLRIFYYYSAMVESGGKIHPTQKPVKLYKWLLTNYAKQGDTILDTHGGSMSIAIACWDLGFDLDICELESDYFDSAVKRFENHIAQTTLF